MVEQFAQLYEDRVRVVGMGSQDNMEQAQDFVDRNGSTTPLMTWDASFETWMHYEVRGQPVTILLDPSGQPIGQWFGLSNELVTIIESEF